MVVPAASRKKFDMALEISLGRCLGTSVGTPGASWEVFPKEACWPQRSALGRTLGRKISNKTTVGVGPEWILGWVRGGSGVR